MPISTSVITGTVAHKHSASGGSSDGGKLATGGLGSDTSFNLANGSLMYSNGTSLDELGIGGAGTILTEAGGVPTWAAPAGGGGFEELANVKLGVAGKLQTGTFTAKENLYVTIFAAQQASTNQAINFNGNVSSIYNYRGASNFVYATQVTMPRAAMYQYMTGNTTNFLLTQMFISNQADKNKMGITQTNDLNGAIGSDAIPDEEMSWFNFNDTVNQITSINLTDDATGSPWTTFQAGSSIVVYGY